MYTGAALGFGLIRACRSGLVLYCSVLSDAGGENDASSAIFERCLLVLCNNWFRHSLGTILGTGHWLKQWWPKFCCHTVTRPQWVKVHVGLRSEKTVLSWYQDTPCCGHTKGICGSAWVSLDKRVYHTDVNINCYAKKRYEICWHNRYSVIWNIMDITWTMIYAMIKLQVFVHLVANTALHLKHLTHWSPGMCMVTTGPCSSQKWLWTLWWKNNIHWW